MALPSAPLLCQLKSSAPPSEPCSSVLEPETDPTCSDASLGDRLPWVPRVACGSSSRRKRRWKPLRPTKLLMAPTPLLLLLLLLPLAPERIMPLSLLLLLLPLLLAVGPAGELPCSCSLRASGPPAPSSALPAKRGVTATDAPHPPPLLQSLSSTESFDSQEASFRGLRASRTAAAGWAGWALPPKGLLPSESAPGSSSPTPTPRKSRTRGPSCDHRAAPSPTARPPGSHPSWDCPPLSARTSRKSGTEESCVQGLQVIVRAGTLCVPTSEVLAQAKWFSGGPKGATTPRHCAVILCVCVKANACRYCSGVGIGCGGGGGGNTPATRICGVSGSSAMHTCFMGPQVLLQPAHSLRQVVLVLQFGDAS
eukprot:1159447-Pelagomonas_calceolata.AAC.9